MLVLSRREDEVVVLDIPPSDKWQTVEVMVIETRSKLVRLGFKADASIDIMRKELIDEDGEEDGAVECDSSQAKG
jgi:carbon storage regulator CsrA